MTDSRKCLRSLSVALLGALLSLASPAAAVSLVTGLGGPDGYGENRLPRSDDGSFQIDISSVFTSDLSFYGSSYNAATEVYINVNGNVSLGGAMSTYTPNGLPLLGPALIAPYWADADTRRFNCQATGNCITWDLDSGAGTFTVTWDRVGYYNRHVDLTNTFQLIMTDRGAGAFDIQFRYGTMEWTAGDASGGSGGLGGAAPQVGFNAGDGVMFLDVLAGNDPLSLDAASNGATPGVFDFTSGGPQVASLPEPDSRSLMVAGVLMLVLCQQGAPRKGRTPEADRAAGPLAERRPIVAAGPPRQRSRG